MQSKFYLLVVVSPNFNVDFGSKRGTSPSVADGCLLRLCCKINATTCCIYVCSIGTTCVYVHVCSFATGMYVALYLFISLWAERLEMGRQ